MSTNIKLVTFDAYSALFDIEGSLVPLVNETLNHFDVDYSSFFKMWRTRQWDYLLLNNSLAKGNVSYRYITRCALVYTLSKYKLSLSEKDIDSLVNGWERLNPWPESQEVILKIKSMGFKVAILSNGDSDMLAPLQNQLGVQMDYIFSAEKGGSYKPSPNIYQLPLNECFNISEVLHVAGSPFDMMGAKSFGLICAWSNRFNDFSLDDKYKPDMMFNNLNGLLEVLN